MAGETNMSAHIKRVYFGTLKPFEGPIAEVKTGVDQAVYMLDKLTAAAGIAVRDRDDSALDESDLQLRVMVLLYIMVHASVDKTTQVWADRYINRDALEAFLKAGG